MTYFGSVEDFLADQPTVLTDDTYNKMSRAFHRELTDLREEYPARRSRSSFASSTRAR